VKHCIAVTILSGLLITSPVAAHPAWGIVVDSQGQVYFSDLETVWKRDPQGRVSQVRSGVSGRHIHDLAIDAADTIHGIDNTYDPDTETYPRALWKLSAAGDFAYVVPATADLPIGRSIWMDSTGATFSVEPFNNERKETKIIKRTSDGTTTLFAGGVFGHRDGAKDTARFSMITDIAFATDDTAYVTDGGTIRRIDRTGHVTTLFRSAGASRLFGLAVDSDRSVVVADPEARRVFRVTASGTSVVIATSARPWRPTGVALRGGDLYVLESWHLASARSGTRVRRVAADGTTSVLASVGATPSALLTESPCCVLAALAVGLATAAVAIRQLFRLRRRQ
jgi:hypothetical protein